MTNRLPFHKRRSVRITAVVVAVLGLALAWWLISPLFIDKVVDEPFPRAAMAVIPDDMTPAEVEDVMMEAEAIDAVVDEDMPATDMSEAEPPSTTPADPEATATTTAAAETTTTAMDAVETTEPQAPEPVATGPVAVATGALMDADDFHKGSGQVTVYRLEDGSHVLRLEDIEVTNGPDLRVIVAPAHGITNREALQAAGYIELAPLKGNIGSQNYDFPADYQVPEQVTVIIYCRPFHVIFATAELS